VTLRTSSFPSIVPVPISPWMGEATRLSLSKRIGAVMFRTRKVPERVSPIETVASNERSGSEAPAAPPAPAGGCFEAPFFAFGSAHSSATKRFIDTWKDPVPSGFPCTTVPVSETRVEPTVAFMERIAAVRVSPSMWNPRSVTGRWSPCTVPASPCPVTVHRTTGAAGGLFVNDAPTPSAPALHVGVFGRTPFRRVAGARAANVPETAPPGSVEPLASNSSVTPEPLPFPFAVSRLSAVVRHPASTRSSAKRFEAASTFRGRSTAFPFWIIAADVPVMSMLQEAVADHVAGVGGATPRRSSSSERICCGFPVTTSASPYGPPGSVGFRIEPLTWLVSEPSDASPRVIS
jgi:hypothetical protein